MEFKRKYLIRFASILLFILFLSNCKKESVLAPVGPTPVTKVIPDTSIINRFIYNNLQVYYLWVDSVPALTAQKYTIKDSLNAFLNSYADPQMFFSNLLYKYNTVDKWSFLVNNSKIIDNWIQGISETMGYDFMLARIGTSGDVFGFVRYVFKGSPAEKAGMKRGDLFMQVNDQQLTVSNYQTLLFTTLTYKLSFATITGDNVSGRKITLNGRTVNMTAITMQENPIELDTVLNINNTKIGYLVYNEFNAAYDLQLNQVFKKFKDAGISKLVLDLRYNGGGSVQTATYLASMIYGTTTSKVFIKNQYNTEVQAYLTATYGANYFNTYFTDKILKTTTTAETPINTLNLTKLYVITSSNTASASELLINGLKPYLQVVNVGTNTAGKYVASITVKDWDANGVVNPKNNWAMQPIVLKFYNSQGVSDFRNGLVPDVNLQEDFTNLIAFGDQNETLLKGVLNDIKGLPQTGMLLKSADPGLTKVFDAQDQRPFAKQMYVNPMPMFKKP